MYRKCWLSAILVLQILTSMDVTVCVIQYYTDQWQIVHTTLKAYPYNDDKASSILFCSIFPSLLRAVLKIDIEIIHFRYHWV